MAFALAVAIGGLVLTGGWGLPLAAAIGVVMVMAWMTPLPWAVVILMLLFGGGALMLVRRPFG